MVLSRPARMRANLWDGRVLYAKKASRNLRIFRNKCNKQLCCWHIRDKYAPQPSTTSTPKNIFPSTRRTTADPLVLSTVKYAVSCVPNTHNHQLRPLTRQPVSSACRPAPLRISLRISSYTSLMILATRITRRLRPEVETDKWKNVPRYSLILV